MYFGSVRFFKHLILTVVFGWIAVSTFFAVFFGVKYNMEKKKEPSEPVVSVSSDGVLNVPDGTTVEQVYLALAAKGYGPEDIMEFLRQTDEDAVDRFVKDNYGSIAAETTVITEAPETSVSAEDAEPSESVTEVPVSSEDKPYTKLYPQLYAEYPESFGEDTKTVYLTFDDGPSDNTLMILSILRKYDIKATFFMSGSTTEKGKAIMEQVAAEGHAIGVHSYSHDYEKIYESVDSYLDDFNNTYNIIKDATGVSPNIFRFAGGSYNDYNHEVYDELVAEMTRRGFVYYDWNVSAQDAVVKPTWTYIYNNVLDGVKANTSNRQIILMHDSADKYVTVTTVEDIIVDYNHEVYDELVAEMTRRGFVYYDWNVSAQDAVVKPTWTYIYNNVLDGVKANTSNRQIILMHDSADKYVTVTTVEDIIVELMKDGYSFDKLDNTVPPTQIVKY